MLVDADISPSPQCLSSRLISHVCCTAVIHMLFLSLHSTPLHPERAHSLIMLTRKDMETFNSLSARQPRSNHILPVSVRHSAYRSVFLGRVCRLSQDLRPGLPCPMAAIMFNNDQMASQCTHPLLSCSSSTIQLAPSRHSRFMRT